MRQTPIHEIHNAEVLMLIPKTSKKIIEIGCSSGVLAREFKKNHPDTYWTGVEIDPDYAVLASRYCDAVLVANPDEADMNFYESYSDCDCWVFADVLEHFRDPWAVIRKIRQVLPDDGCVVACIPNAQNWSLIARLAVGDFRYEDMGLLDRTHLRWFTRQTIYELFKSENFMIVEEITRTFQHPNSGVLELIGKIAEECGFDPKQTMAEATPLQYVVRAVPT